MYVWLWRRLPGGIPGKLAGCLVLLVGVLALLFYIVFPWAEEHLPFNNVTIDHAPASPAPQTPSPSP